jgi:hypothetical protein
MRIVRGLRGGRAHALWSLLAVLLAFTALVACTANPTTAQTLRHFGKNRLEFAPVAPFVLPEATGTGIIDYEGGKEPSSQWRASFRFTGLAAEARYTVVIKGRFGEPGSAEANAFTALCAFTTDAAGEGGCFWYFRGLARLNVVHVRAGDDPGSPVLEASRGRGPGAIETRPNRFSPGGELPHRS